MTQYSDNLRRSLSAFWVLSLARISRIFHSVAVTILLTVLGCLASVWVSWKGGSKTVNVDLHFLLFWGGLFGLLVVGLQTALNYRTSKYDVSLALQYSNIFFDDLKGKRFEAAKVVLQVAKSDADKKKDVDILEVEPVLDVLEDIGFLVKHGRISDEVAHHYFSHWIQLYIQPIEWHLLESKKKGETRYNHLLLLYDRMRATEYEQGKYDFWSQLDLNKINYGEDQLQKELQDEIDDCAPPVAQ